jgi:hypothetical protein
VSKSIYPSIPAAGNTIESVRASLDAVRQTLNMLIINAQNPNPNFTPSSAAQVFLTKDTAPKGGGGADLSANMQNMIGLGTDGGLFTLDAPTDGQYYARQGGQWVVIPVSGGGGGGVSASSIPQPSTVLPLPNIQPPLIGTSLNYSREDHQHSTEDYGITDGSNAYPGRVGEYIFSTLALSGVSSSVIVSLCSVALTAGEWEIGGYIQGQFATNPGTLIIGGFSTTATLSSWAASTYIPTAVLPCNMNVGETVCLSLMPVRSNNTTTVSIYLLGEAFFPSQGQLGGHIYARRVR